MTPKHNILQSLQGCRQTTITTADGQPMVLFHTEPLDEEERRELESCTADELKAIVIANMKNPTVIDLN